MNSILANESFLIEYLPIIIFLGISSFLAFAISILPKFLATSKPYEDKISPYECGFDTFKDARSKFDIKFYLVGILFIIFDLEITFLVPWAVSLGKIGTLWFYSMMFFLFILTLGFVYEWKKGVLDW